MIKFTKFLKVAVHLICLLVASNLNAQTWPPAGMNGNGTAGNPWQITTIAQLQALATYVNAGNGPQTAKVYYKLMNDIACPPSTTRLGWNPIGLYFSSFQGHFDGNSKVISNLSINKGTTSHIGLFGYINNAEIKNLGIESCQITGNECVGSLVGTASGTSTIEDCYMTDGNVSGYRIVGGLIGEAVNDSNVNINNCYTTGSINGTAEAVGGLVGWIYFATSNISNCYSLCEVGGHNQVGGLVGSSYNYYGGIYKSYAGGNVRGRGTIGGLVGALFVGNNVDCYATGNITAIETGSFIGGLIGINYATATYCYATGNIIGTGEIGGLAGASPGTLKNSVAANDTVVGILQSINRIAGLVYPYSIFSNNYAFDGMVITPNNGEAGISTPIDTLMSFNFYNTGSNWYQNVPWDIDDMPNSSVIWGICDGETLPFFQWQGFDCGIKVPLYNGNNEDNSFTVQNGKSTISIFPNPTSNHITISSEEDFHFIEIFDMVGRIVHSQMNYEKTITLNVSNYGTGMYFVRIISKNGAKVQKFVKK